MSRINIRQVAKAAGVSTATVSRVINGTGPVKPETREKVMRVVEQEGFHPNRLGQKLRNSHSGMLLVMVSSIGNPFCALVVCGIESEAERRGYHIILCNSESSPQREAAYLKLLHERTVDGVITMDATTQIDALKEHIGHHPWVQCGEYKQGVAPFVSIDNYSAARAAVDHLIQSGKKRIAMISAREGYKYAQEREQGYLDSLAEAGLSWHKIVHVRNVMSFADGASAYEALTSGDEPCDAIFGISDMLACGALNAAVKAGKAIPDQLAVVGFDGVPCSEITVPMMTTIQQPMLEMGNRSAGLLIDQIEGKLLTSHESELLLPWKLVPRDSTR
ncbi:LacI family DNA-binding transcriptional regulator [Ewingella americana]|uniref:LacI family DNA-binding transcriptional regulator n=1 Tax=Ewingella americana TaxID=41202 RepID=UPI0012ADDB91|nr:LacI family DNA-binding transcriptional regulator [Ewingella americana]